MEKSSCLNAGNMQSSNNQLTLTSEQKVEVLLHALSERYHAIHNIRDRVQNVCIWTLGLFITAGGWLLQSNSSLDNIDKILFTTMIVITIVVIRYFYLGDLEKGFRTQQQIQAKLEDTLGLCEPGIFRQDELYPKEWAQAGSKNGKGNFFLHNYYLIYLGATLFIICIWMAK